MFQKNTGKYITFTVPIEKEVTRIDKNGDEVIKTNKSYVLQFIDSARFIGSYYQISSTIFLKKFIELNVNVGKIINNVKHVGLNITIVTVFLNRKTLKMI